MCVQPEIMVGIQSLGLLAIGWRFSHLQKEIIKANYNDRCAETGTKRHLEVHHIVPVSLGGADIIENGVPLTTRVHKPWDEKTIEDGICYPGVPIDQVPHNLFTSERKREQVIYKFKKQGAI